MPCDRSMDLFGRLRRSNSQPLVNHEGETIKANANHPTTTGFPAWRPERMRPAPDLDGMFGRLHKPGGQQNNSMPHIHHSELEPGGGRTVRVHPNRLLFPAYDIHPGRASKLRKELGPFFSKMRVELYRNGRNRHFCYNWIVTRSGQVAVAPSHIRYQHTNILLQLGHPPLIGGFAAPMGRIGGELRYAGIKDGQPLFFINSKSGRYSADLDRRESQLKRVADRFRALGFPVEMQWIGPPQWPRRVITSIAAARPNAAG